MKLDIESPSTCPPRNITVANNTFMIGNPVPARHGFAIFIAATDDNTTVTDVAPSLPNRLSGSGIIKDNVVEANDNYPQWLIYAYSSMVKMSSTAAVTFTRGEKVTGTGGSARFIDKFGLYLLLVDQVGPFSGSVTLTGAISGATDTTDASPQNLGTGYIVRDNSDLMSRNNNVAIT